MLLQWDFTDAKPYMGNACIDTDISEQPFWIKGDVQRGCSAKGLRRGRSFDFLKRGMRRSRAAVQPARHAMNAASCK